MAVIQNDSINEGPAPGREASPAAAVPTVAKIPAPMIAPIPRSVILNAPRLRFNEWVGSPRCARMSSRVFVRKIPRSKGCRLRKGIWRTLFVFVPAEVKESLRTLAWNKKKLEEKCARLLMANKL